MRSLSGSGGKIWPNGIREAWRHIGNSETESVLEPCRNGVLGKLTCHEVLRNCVSPDSISLAVLLVIVHDQLSGAIVVQINELDRISTQSGRVDRTTINQGAIDK